MIVCTVGVRTGIGTCEYRSEFEVIKGDGVCGAEGIRRVWNGDRV